MMMLMFNKQWITEGRIYQERKKINKQEKKE